MFGRVESEHSTSASFCYVSNIDTFQYVTQYRTCTDKIRSTSSCFELIQIYTFVSEVQVCLKDTFQARLAQSVKGSVDISLAVYQI